MELWGRDHLLWPANKYRSRGHGVVSPLPVGLTPVTLPGSRTNVRVGLFFQDFQGWPARLDFWTSTSDFWTSRLDFYDFLGLPGSILKPF